MTDASSPTGPAAGAATGPDRTGRLLPVLFALAGGVALFQGLAPLVGWKCDTCTGGVLSLVLPWAGAAFYVGLALFTWRRPASPALSRLLSLAVFVHGSLMLESVLVGRWCPECVLVAVLAGLAAGVQVWVRPADLLSLGAGLLLGMASGFFSPFDRVDQWLTRMVWPARLLTNAPSFVDRGEMASCGDASDVRMIIYERDCRACNSAQRRVLPQVREEFPVQVCVHSHEVQNPPKDQRLPLLILVSKKMQVLILEGMPDYPELRTMILTLMGKKRVSLHREPGSTGFSGLPPDRALPPGERLR